MEDDRHEVLLREAAEAIKHARVSRPGVTVSDATKSDAMLVVAAIIDAFLCTACIARKTEVPEKDVVVTLEKMRETIHITSESRRCDGCLRADVVRKLG